MSSSYWPKVAAQLAKNVAAAAFTHDYASVWKYLHPSYQAAVSESRWRTCQAAHPAAPRSVTITKVSVASATELPVELPLLGRQYIQEIQLQIQFKTPLAAGTQFALEYTFWLKQGAKWEAVWLPEEYSAYKAGSCYLTPQGPPLY